MRKETHKPICLVKLYTIIAISSTLLELYGVSYSLNTFTWRFAAVLLFCGLALVSSKGNFRITAETWAFIPFILCVIIGFFSNLYLGTSGFELRLARFLILFIFAVIIGQDYFDGEYAMKVYRLVVWVATIVMIIQVIFANFLHKSFVGHLPLPLRSPIYANANYYLRYYSIFEEPGYYGIYVAPYVCIKLYEKRINYFELGMILASLLLSTSTSNILVFAFIIGSYVFFIDNKKISQIKQIVIKILIIAIGALAIYFFINSPQYQFVQKRLTIGVSTESRTTGYFNLNYYIGDNILYWLFGNAMDKYPISGYATLIITFGIIGAIAYLVGIIHLFLKTNNIGKYVIIVFLFLNIGNVEFLGNASSMLIVFPFATWLIKNEFGQNNKANSEEVVCNEKKTN